MEFPLSVREMTMRLAEKYQISELKSLSAEITEKYKVQSGHGKRLLKNEKETLVYAIVRMPATFAAVCGSLEAAAGCDVRTVLDVGSGTGSAMWAADAVFSPDSFVCIEREKDMLSLGRTFAEMGSYAVQNSVWLNEELSEDLLSDKKADLVTASYVLNELSEEKRNRMINALWNSAEKMLVITEPGTPEGFRQILKARELLIASGAYIAAPCPGNSECRLSRDDWCHFTARVQRSKLHKQIKEGEVPYEDEKYCYIAAMRYPPKNISSRVLRHPIVSKGMVKLRLCTPDGIVTETITKKDKEKYKAAKKAEINSAYNQHMTRR